MQFCCGVGNEAGYQAIITSILPVIAIALEDEKPEVLSPPSFTTKICEKTTRWMTIRNFTEFNIIFSIEIAF